MNVSIDELTEKMRAALLTKGFAGENADFLIEMYLGGELRGHTSHGLASFPGFMNQDWSNLQPPEVISETASLYLIDAKSNPGAIIGKQAADQAIKRADVSGVGTAIIKNMDSWLRPGAIAQYVANKDYLTIVINNGGGATIAPPGGYDPVVGTNPIAYGIPTNDEPLVVDMATAKRAWGQVRLANKYSTDLPADTFYNSAGEVTLNPKEASSVMSFGEYKGFALALLVEVMTGSLVDMAMMTVNSTGGKFGDKLSERGGVIIVIDPRKTTDLKRFKAANSELVEKIKAGHSLAGESVRVPGDEAGALQARKLRAKEINIPEELWSELSNLAQ